ncbi:hypothetical protein [Myxococcus qinghaiensis]|uniref:hypothetical protein n=1 Tax=Myxococcus qinghaiensis TaxID=2906758 RepID=UPI0020A6FBFB|nr:hypothetical protein [Myxococcus qinghaiensis]MCP3166357.1 hypothetical protein [Myxococcus qinghaiensis]
MWRWLSVMALCAAGLMACGTEVAGAEDALGSQEQGLACESGTGECPGGTTCAYLPGSTEEGLCRLSCVNNTCPYAHDVCCTQPYGAPYCDSSCS